MDPRSLWPLIVVGRLTAAEPLSSGGYSLYHRAPVRCAGQCPAPTDVLGEMARIVSYTSTMTSQWYIGSPGPYTLGYY